MPNHRPRLKLARILVRASGFVPPLQNGSGARRAHPERAWRVLNQMIGTAQFIRTLRRGRRHGRGHVERSGHGFERVRRGWHVVPATGECERADQHERSHGAPPRRGQAPRVPAAVVPASAQGRRRVCALHAPRQPSRCSRRCPIAARGAVSARQASVCPRAPTAWSPASAACHPESCRTPASPSSGYRW